MKENRPEQAGIRLFMLRAAFRSCQASHRLLRIRSASMAQCDGMRSEHHPKQFGMPPAAYRDKATNSDDPASHDNDVAVRSGAESDLISVDQHVVPSPSSSASSLLLAANGVPEMR